MDTWWSILEYISLRLKTVCFRLVQNPKTILNTDAVSKHACCKIAQLFPPTDVRHIYKRS